MRRVCHSLSHFVLETVLEGKFLLFSLNHIFKIFAHDFYVIRMGDAQILVDVDRSFRAIIIDGVIEGCE